jgi:hypothetical protein
VYECDTWSLTLWDEHRLRVFREQGVKENKYMDLERRKWWEAGEDCIEKLHNLLASLNIIRVFKSRRMR